jgi:hypothetical protein
MVLGIGRITISVIRCRVVCMIHRGAIVMMLGLSSIFCIIKGQIGLIYIDREFVALGFLGVRWLLWTLLNVVKRKQ